MTFFLFYHFHLSLLTFNNQKKRVSYLFKSPSNCNAAVISFNFFMGLVGPGIVLILQIIAKTLSMVGQGKELKRVVKITTCCLRIFPSFNFGKALLFATNIEALQQGIMNKEMTVWSDDVLRIEVLCLAVQSILYVVLAILIDEFSGKPIFVRIQRFFTSFKSYIRRISSRGYAVVSTTPAENTNQEVEEDEDVRAEIQRMNCGQANEDLMVLSNLRKEYPNGKVAVNKISLGIPPGQCFGLLGINGAGKTTTMSMLTAEFPPTSGEITLAGHSVTAQPQKTRRLIGYCPQFDAHFDNLTGREHLRLYASIKGLKKDFVDNVVRMVLEQVGLSAEDGDRLSSNYSGGMKRKLSVGCAIIGNPQVSQL